MPRPESGRWESAGAIILGTEFSLAWRVLDAQFWGVAQRRRRIFLVADFGGTTAPEILFKQDSLFGDLAQSGGPRQGTAAPTEGCPDDTGGACLTPWDVQSRRIFKETGTWPSLYGGEGGGHGYIQTEEKTAIAFAANQRDEVRDLHDIAGAVQAQPGMKQQTFVAQPEEMTAFHVNQRNELIDLHGKSGALMATRSDQMQTFVLQGNMIGRKDENGPQGDGVNEDVCFTLDATDRHAICAPEDVYAMTTGSYMQVAKEVAPTLMARDYKDPTTIAPVPHLNEGVMGTVATGAHPSGFNGQDAFNDRLVIDNPEAQPAPVTYTVRRLTPTECARLQGFPDWWCRDLGTENPTEEDLAFWADVFETHRKIVTHAKKPKTEKQIRKWLADPYTDSAEYRIWGNGICLANAFFVLAGIAWCAGLEE